MKYSTTFYILFNLSTGNPPDGFMDQPYKAVLQDITEIIEMVSPIKQIMMLSATVELDELIKNGYFDNEPVSVQDLLDELKENEPEEFENALASYQKANHDFNE